MTDEIREAFEKLHNFDLETDEDGDYTKLETSTCFNFYMAGHQAAKADSAKEIATLRARVAELENQNEFVEILYVLDDVECAGELETWSDSCEEGETIDLMGYKCSKTFNASFIKINGKLIPKE